MWWLAFAVAALLLAAAAWAAHRAQGQWALAHTAQAAAAQAANSERPAAGEAALPPDFTHRLPAQGPSATEVAALLQQHCKAARVQLLDFSTSERPAAPSVLGRREVHLELAGDYAAIKRVLAEVLAARADSASLRQLRLRADPEAGTVRAWATLVFWSASAQAAGRPEGGGPDGPRPRAEGTGR